MKIVNTTLGLIKRNSPVILSSTAIVGVFTTSYLTAKASFTARRRLDMLTTDAPRKKEIEEVWKLYIPAAVSGVATIVCIVGSTKIGNKRALAAQAAFVLSERAYSEYRGHVIEEFGEKAEQKVRDKIAEKRVKENPPGQELTIISGGDVLCCELYTGRYFKSDMETLRRKENDLNAMLIRQDVVSMEEWYHLIGLPSTSFCSDIGWNSDKLMKLEFSTVLTNDGKPCLAFQYNYHRLLYDGICP